MTTQTEERTGFRRTLVRVLAMQIATLLLLGALQAYFTP